MLALLKLLQTDVMTDTVKHAAGKILIYTRNDLAHERFDCDWARDWRCMEELLTALGCSSAADDLRKFCEPLNKSHCDKEGDICRTHEYTACAFVACVRAHVRLCARIRSPRLFHSSIVAACPGTLLCWIMRAYWKMHTHTDTVQKEIDRKSKAFHQAMRPFVDSGLPHGVCANDCHCALTALIMVRFICPLKCRSRCTYAKIG